MEVQVNRMGSRAAHYGEQLVFVAARGLAQSECRFADGSSIRIVPAR